MLHIVKIYNQDDESEIEYHFLSEGDAIYTANRLANESIANVVTISSYSSGDGQTIYLNRDGYSSVGKQWKKI